MRSAGTLILLLAATCTLAPVALAAGDEAACLPPGRWGTPGAGRVDLQATDRTFARLAQQQVVLLGESHENPEHHRWQLQTMAGLHALRPDLVLGFEMFPRRVQPILDRWVAGELTEEALLAQTDWPRSWGMDAALYMPLFQFARMNRVPMLALNVDRALVARVGAEGWGVIAGSEREGVTDPAPASPEYLAALHEAYLEHQPDAGHGAARPAPAAPDLHEPKFRRFVEGQLLWDRAMAQRLAEPIRAGRAPLAVGILGSGHVRQGFGVPHQLRDLGVLRVAGALPWEGGCADVRPGLADALFGVAAVRAAAAAPPPRLGIGIEPVAHGVRVREVTPGSVAAQAGLLPGDVITRVAGQEVRDPDDLIQAVRRQPGGTLLPLGIRRGEQTLELLPRFPPHP